MKKFYSSILILVTLAVLVCGCFEEKKVITADMRGGSIETDSHIKEKDNSKKDTEEVDRTPTSKPTLESTTPMIESIEEKLNSLTLEEKIGQMIMVGVYGTELNDDIIFSMNNFHFGGVIFFDRNLESVAQAKKLAKDIESVANQKVPMFFAIDEEGGIIVRGQEFLEAAPSQESIGFEGDPEVAKYWAEHNATILKNINVNLNFAPVADVGSRDTRSFGDDPQVVAQFVDAAARGYEKFSRHRKK